jgi:steroid delta-isomerase-like uncharacterized protein
VADVQEITKRWIEAFNAHDEDGLLSVTGAEAVLEAPGDVHVEGRDAVVEYAMNWLSAFPDAEMEVEQEIAADGWVTHRFTFEGTQSGTFAGPTGEIPPTHRQLNGRGAQLMRIAAGEITETYLYFDQLQVLTQLGLIREAVGGPSR